MEEKLHRRWVKIGGKKGSIFDGNFQFDLNPSDIVFLSCCLDNFFYLLGNMLNT